MKTPQQLRDEAKGLREYAVTLFNLNHNDIALGKLSEATRRETWAEVLEGKRDILKACVEKANNSKTGAASQKLENRAKPPDRRKYQLRDTGGLKAHADFLTRQAYHRIAERQIEKPYRKKPMPNPVFR